MCVCDVWDAHKVHVVWAAQIMQLCSADPILLSWWSSSRNGDKVKWSKSQCTESVSAGFLLITVLDIQYQHEHIMTPGAQGTKQFVVLRVLPRFVLFF